MNALRLLHLIKVNSAIVVSEHRYFLEKILFQNAL